MYVFFRLDIVKLLITHFKLISVWINLSKYFSLVLGDIKENVVIKINEKYIGINEIQLKNIFVCNSKKYIIKKLNNIDEDITI